MTVHRFGVDPSEIMTSHETQELDDCFIIPKIHCFHRAQISLNTNKKNKTKTLVKYRDHILTDFDQT